MDYEIMKAWNEVKNSLSNLKSKSKWFIDKQHEDAIIKVTDEFQNKLSEIFQDLT